MGRNRRFIHVKRSSLLIFNCGHEANAHLAPALTNRVAGKYLHRFGWLDETLIGEIPER